MASTRVKLMKGALSTMHSLGVHSILRPLSEGLGMILTLHRVRPANELEAELGAFPAFNPNGLLEITPEFLDATFEALKAQGLAIVSLDEAVEAIKSPSVQKGRFVVFTFDDGYIDNRDHALPVLEAHAAPTMIYMPSDFPQGKGELWWVALEEMIRAADTLVRPDQPEMGERSVRTAEEKLAFYLDFYWALRSMGQDEQRRTIRKMAEDQGYNLDALCRHLILSMSELQDLSAHPLITIGAHTVTHRAIARLSPEEAIQEMVDGADWLEETLGHRPKHFSFPYGDPCSADTRDYQLARDAGFETAVTTRKGMLYADHADHLFGLPRVSLNGEFQEEHYIEVFASGAPFLLANKFRKMA
ncbi:MAG: polysaccharide deacetylase family protein [Hyphomicrobiales bacterium]|jgi:peptidoglycan/xylan/chitin deacetylase (PgdA/CDA1 family)